MSKTLIKSKVRTWTSGGGDVPKLEPIRGLHYSRVDKIVRDLRRIYKDNPASFDVPAFAVKVY